MVSEARKQSMAWMETDYSKDTLSTSMELLTYEVNIMHKVHEPLQIRILEFSTFLFFQCFFECFFQLGHWEAILLNHKFMKTLLSQVGSRKPLYLIRSCFM